MALGRGSRIRIAAGLGLAALCATAAPAAPRMAGPRSVAPNHPLPPPRPSEPVPSAGTPPSPAPASRRGPADDDPAACVARLAARGLKLETKGAVREGACGAAHVFVAKELAPGIALQPPATAGCPVAEAFAAWLSDAVAPAALEHLGAAPTAVLVGASYECRGRNRVPGAKLSEHAFANAIDVMGFAFAKRPAVTVGAAASDAPEGRFLAAIRAKACERFKTVLGPGSDQAHRDHLHLDLRERGRGARLCQ